MTSAVIFIKATPSLHDVGDIKNGCYTGDALLLYVQCDGFYGAELVNKLINTPYLVIQMLAVAGPLGLVLLLLPATYIPWYLYKHNK